MQVRVGDMLEEKKRSRFTYIIKEVKNNHWGDGGVGYRLLKMYRGNEVEVPFWVTQEELESIYVLCGS